MRLCDEPQSDIGCSIAVPYYKFKPCLKRISRELRYTSGNIRGHAWHLCPWFLNGRLWLCPWLSTCLYRIILRYIWWFVGISGLQCLTRRTWNNYWWTATGDFKEGMEVSKPDDSNAQNRRYTSVVSPCETVLPRIWQRKLFNRAEVWTSIIYHACQGMWLVTVQRSNPSVA